MQSPHASLSRPNPVRPVGSPLQRPDTSPPSVLVDLYRGPTGRRMLVRSLRTMSLVDDCVPLANDIADHADLVLTREGVELISEGNDEHDLHFVLTGKLQILVGNREVAILNPGSHVGELALVDPGALRSATVRGLRETVTARLSSEKFMTLARRHPDLWARLSQALATNIRGHNRHVRPNPRPRMLLVATSAALPFAQAIQAHVSDEGEATPRWTVAVDPLPDADSLPELRPAFADADFGAIVTAPGETDPMPVGERPLQRDALFTLCGMSLGALSIERTFLIQHQDPGIASPATVLGLPPLLYNLDPNHDLKSDLLAICEHLRRAIVDLGCL